MRSPLTARRIGLLPSVSSQASQASTKRGLAGWAHTGCQEEPPEPLHHQCLSSRENHIDDVQVYDAAVRRTTKRRLRRTSCGLGEASMIATLIPTGCGGNSTI